jgi:hypothetical protein
MGRITYLPTAVFSLFRSVPDAKCLPGCVGEMGWNDGITWVKLRSWRSSTSDLRPGQVLLREMSSFGCSFPRRQGIYLPRNRIPGDINRVKRVNFHDHVSLPPPPTVLVPLPPLFSRN